MAKLLKKEKAEKVKKPKKPKLSKEEKKQLKKENKQNKKEAKKQEKEEQERTKERIEQATAPVIWEYAHDADLTIGETKLSNKAKIALIIVLLLITALSVVGYIYRYYILDYFQEPQTLLKENEIEVEVNSKFDYKDYLLDVEYPDRYVLTYPKNSQVDTKKLGDYELDFKIENLSKETQQKLIVHVVDKTPPTIELKESAIQLERGGQTEKFDATKYIKKVSDNYDKEKDIQITHTQSFDWSKDQVEVEYVATDKSGNITIEKMAIIVNDPPKEPEVVYVEKPVETPTVTEQGGSSGGSSGGGSSSSGGSGESSGNSNSGGNSSGGGTQQSSPPPAPSHYINGTHDISVKVGTDFNSLAGMLTSGITSDEYVNVDFSSVNLTIPGSYSVVYSTPNVTKTITVTVTE